MRYKTRPEVIGVTYTMKEFASKINEQGVNWGEERFEVDLDTQYIAVSETGSVSILKEQPADK